MAVNVFVMTTLNFLVYCTTVALSPIGVENCGCGLARARRVQLQTERRLLDERHGQEATSGMVLHEVLPHTESLFTAKTTVVISHARESRVNIFVFKKYTHLINKFEYFQKVNLT